MLTNSKMRWMKASIGVLLLTLISITTISFQAVTDKEDLLPGNDMPLGSYEMEGADGSTYTLEGLMGENGLIVVFSCNTCPFVVGSDNFEGWEVQYNDLYEKAQENGVEMVLINSNAAKREGVDSKSEMKTHADAQGYTMPYVVDKDAKLADAMGAKTTPHVYMFDENKKLIYKGSIDNGWDTNKESLETYLIDAISAVGSGSSIENDSTTPRGCSIKRTK